MKGSQFLLKTDTLATCISDYVRDQLVLIPANSEITLLDESLAATSVRVSWNGWDLAVFSEALRSQAIELTRKNDMYNNELNETEESDDDLSVTEQLRLVDQLLALSKRCWSRSLKSFDSELAEMRKNLLQESESERVLGAVNGR
jgi:hypothetical protein